MYLDEILISIEDVSQLYEKAKYWVLDQLEKYELLPNLKKYQFHHEVVCFLGFVVLAQRVQIEEKRIKVVKV